MYPACHSWLQAHIAILAGGCLALGLRFAGSQNAGAAAVIQQQLRHFLRCKALVPDAAAGNGLAALCICYDMAQSASFSNRMVCVGH